MLDDLDVRRAVTGFVAELDVLESYLDRSAADHSRVGQEMYRARERYTTTVGGFPDFQRMRGDTDLRAALYALAVINAARASRLRAASEGAGTFLQRLQE